MDRSVLSLAALALALASERMTRATSAPPARPRSERYDGSGRVWEPRLRPHPSGGNLLEWREVTP